MTMMMWSTQARRRIDELSPTDNIHVFCDETKMALGATYCECLGNPLEGEATADCAQGDNTVKLTLHDGDITETEFCLPEKDEDYGSMYHVCITEYRVGEKACEGFLLWGGAREQDDCGSCAYSDDLCPEGESKGIELTCPFSKRYEQSLTGAICVRQADGSSDLTIVYTNATLAQTPSDNQNNHLNNQPNNQGNPTYTAIYNASDQDIANGVAVILILCVALMGVGFLGRRAFHQYCASSIQPQHFLGDVELGDTPQRRRRRRNKKLEKKESSDYSTVEQSEQEASVTVTPVA